MNTIENYKLQGRLRKIKLEKLLHAGGVPGYFFLLYSIVMFIVKRQRNVDDYATVDASALVQIVYTVVVFFFSFYHLFVAKYRKINMIFRKPQIFLLFYIGICFLSMLWSSNIFISGFRAFEMLSFLMLISLLVENLLTKLDAQNIIEWAVFWVIWELFWSIATSVKLMGFSYLFWPFESSRLVIPMLFFFALMLTKRKWFKFIIIVFSILAVSNKVYFGIAFGLIGYFFGNSKYKVLLFSFILTIILSLIFIDFEELLKSTLFYGREAVSMTETSGRDQIWSLAWNSFLERPIFGYGFVAGESNILHSEFRGAISTHNFFLSGLLGTGIVGTFFLVLYFISTFILGKSRYFPAINWRPAMVSTFIMCLIVSLTAPGIGGRVYGSWLPVVFMFTLISGLQLKFKAQNELTHKKKALGKQEKDDKQVFNLQSKNS